MPKMRLAKIIKAKLCNFVKKKRSVRNEKLEMRSKWIKEIIRTQKNDVTEISENKTRKK